MKFVIPHVILGFVHHQIHFHFQCHFQFHNIMSACKRNVHKTVYAHYCDLDSHTKTVANKKQHSDIDSHTKNSSTSLLFTQETIQVQTKKLTHKVTHKFKGYNTHHAI
jgi:hypothetical protein